MVSIKSQDVLQAVVSMNTIILRFFQEALSVVICLMHCLLLKICCSYMMTQIQGHSEESFLYRFFL